MNRSESQAMKTLLDEHDLGFCKTLSDVDGLYYFTLRSMEEIGSIVHNQELFTTTVFQLRKIVDAMFPKVSESKREWRRYRIMFREFFVHARVSKKDLKFVDNLFLL